MLYIHTLKNDQKIGKLFDLEGRTGEDEARQYNEAKDKNGKMYADLVRDSMRGNSTLEEFLQKLTQKTKIDSREGRELAQRMFTEKAAVSNETKEKAYKLLMDNGWVTHAQRVKGVKTHSQVADKALDEKVVQTINASVPKVEVPSGLQVTENIQRAISDNPETKKAEVLSKIAKELISNSNVRTQFTDNSRSRNPLFTNILGDNKNISLNSAQEKLRKDNNISYAELVTALNKELGISNKSIASNEAEDRRNANLSKQLGDKQRMAEFQANFPKVETSKADLSSITVKSTFARRGDTLEKIAKEQGIDVGTLLKANPSIRNPNQIAAGTKINFPDFTGTTMVAGRRVDNRATASNPNQSPRITNIGENPLADPEERASRNKNAYSQTNDFDTRTSAEKLAQEAARKQQEQIDKLNSTPFIGA